MTHVYMAQVSPVLDGDEHLNYVVWADPLTAVGEMRNRTSHEGIDPATNNGVGHSHIAAGVLDRVGELRFGRFTLRKVALR